ncbi:MAG: hypothetical protein A2600_11725 [Candidatus Lambdaproteobacteria bacterium RIFOXYD1_FULL_56_27]|uniref:Uncharacterized protein n=1 Tax=Candidatus Lambdaproteobacteria bacterium RIFOXYD2_FULL_56_26 TaxID=1817773 RepID=A0A1F6GXK0_9PROT|nr:MAG: hypothetical protein A2426_12060 [Candidatus Lambdaproteobacteria bacterium RIFOXYC1_FULL_56_13]OGH02771.1 MAG: hypothetical protein A2557_02845 [Candidatus Lambdaproteobacteria bacterium RIFOXYD2_FULL_56_26]OGH08013.1 MAG: hypothetical protein A2600_11725 [Candidatus Lambdaproteobacteria bacterium RIFOXYD1_FULL_56_27]
MEEGQGGLTASKTSPKPKFSARQVMEGMPEKAEGLLAEGTVPKQQKKGPRKPDSKRQQYHYYLSQDEAAKFRFWCQGAEGSEVVRTLIKRSMAKAENYDKL